MQSQEDKQNSIKNARKVTIVVAVFICVFIIAAIIVFFTAKKPLARFTPGQYSPGYIDDANKTLTQDKATLDQNNAIGALLGKLPYQGKNFSMSFDIHKASYIAVISQKNKTEGDQEFDNFLKTNGINSRSSFINLEVQYK